jgi:transcriptional regulator with XRE-family HTH domain
MRQARERLGISQEETGRRLGVTLRTYARWERGESRGWVGYLAEIAKALEVTESELLGGENLLADSPTVEDLAAKLDNVMIELQALRRDLDSN